jgi:hypothetical protein
VLERLNFRKNGQLDSKKHKFSRKPLKKLISGFTPEVITMRWDIPYSKNSNFISGISAFIGHVSRHP